MALIQFRHEFAERTADNLLKISRKIASVGQRQLGRESRFPEIYSLYPLFSHLRWVFFLLKSFQRLVSSRFQGELIRERGMSLSSDSDMCLSLDQDVSSSTEGGLNLSSEYVLSESQ